MSPTTPILLIGADAEALAARLQLSGFQPLAAAQAGSTAPAAVLVAPDGAARLPELRQRWGAIPILLGVETDSVADRRHCLLSGADDFWLSRGGASDVISRLRLHLGQRPSRSGHRFAAAAGTRRWRLADLELDPDSGTARRGQRPLQLTSREYDLLLLLLRRSGEIVSRQEIMTTIWAGQPDITSNVLEVYVRYLRRKLEADGERRLIHTVRGNGYCLTEGNPPPRPEP